jgi:hypothetical protein
MATRDSLHATDLPWPHSLERCVAQPRDPWEPFRFWLAFTLAIYALRALFAAQWPGAIPGWVLLTLLLVALALASKALIFPGRVQPFRQGDGGFWNDLRDDWQLWWKRRRGEE